MSTLLKADLSIKEENKEDFKETVIARKNLTNEFTISSIEKHLAGLKKVQIEGESKRNLAQSYVDNVLRNNPFISEMSKEDQHAVWMYFDNLTTVNEIQPHLDDLYEDQKIHGEYLDIIYDAFGFQDTVVIDTTDAK